MHYSYMILYKIITLCGPFCKLKLAWFSAKLKFIDGPKCGKNIGQTDNNKKVKRDNLGLRFH